MDIPAVCSLWSGGFSFPTLGLKVYQEEEEVKGETRHGTMAEREQLKFCCAQKEAEVECEGKQYLVEPHPIQLSLNIVWKEKEVAKQYRQKGS